MTTGLLQKLSKLAQYSQAWMYNILQILFKYIVIQNMKYKTLIVNLTQQAVRSAE